MLPSELQDTMTSAMMSHFAREITQGSMSLWPQLVQSARQYFNVTHGYVLRKALWQLAPLNSEKKKSSEGEINAEKDWTARVYKGLEVDIEVPDAYIPTMGFITYVLLFCLIQGLQERFSPDVLSSTLTFAVVVLVLETTAAKAALFMAGAVDAPIVDLVALLGYKYFHLSLQLMLGLIIGGGWKPEGVFYQLLSLGLITSCGVALWQVLRRMPRMQPARPQECATDMHKVLIKALPVLQAVVCWCLLPSWAKRPPASSTEAPVATTTVLTAVAAAVAGNASAAAPA